jgi:hypothetical protein
MSDYILDTLAIVAGLAGIAALFAPLFLLIAYVAEGTRPISDDWQCLTLSNGELWEVDCDE